MKKLVALLGCGLAAFAIGCGEEGGKPVASPTPPAGMDPAYMEKMQKSAEAAKAAGDTVKEAANDATEAVKETAKDAVDATKEAVKDAKDAVQEGADAVKKSVKEATKEGGDAAKEESK